MLVKFWGTRGSTAISNRESIEYGGNTTCVEIKSEFLPGNMALVFDAGTGYYPFSLDALHQGIKSIAIFFTHYHHDHTSGLLLAPVTFMKNIPISVFGPGENGSTGPREVIETIMKPPFFPVDFKEVGSHFNFHKIEHPNCKLVAMHKSGGVKLLDTEQYEHFLKKGQILFREGGYDIEECIIIGMTRCEHPERTISYRISEMATGKTFVFLTDHEDQVALPVRLKKHSESADLLVVDSQYTDEKYRKQTAGYGHGTPIYAAKLASWINPKKIGLTHHDPASHDQAIETIVATAIEEAKIRGYQGEIFGCKDYMTIEL